MSVAIHVMPMELEGHDELRIAVVLDNELIAVANVMGAERSVATIYQLFVVPEQRRKGIGMAIIEQVESEAKKWGAKAVSAIVAEDGPVAWWMARGYSPVHLENGRMVVSRKLKD